MSKFRSGLQFDTCSFDLRIFFLDKDVLEIDESSEWNEGLIMQAQE